MYERRFKLLVLRTLPTVKYIEARNAPPRASREPSSKAWLLVVGAIAMKTPRKAINKPKTSPMLKDVLSAACSIIADIMGYVTTNVVDRETGIR